MKKSTLLSLLTTAAIITTTAGTYAVWDVVSAKSESVVKFNRPVSISTDKNLTFTVEHNLDGKNPVASSDVSFTVDHQNGLVNTLTITPTFIDKKTQQEIDRTKFDITINDKVTRSNLSSNNNIFTDESLDSTNYSITIKPKDTLQASEVLEVSGKEIDVKLTAELSKTPTQSAEKETH